MLLAQPLMERLLPPSRTFSRRTKRRRVVLTTREWKWFTRDM
jgi:hypothetical protein